MSKSNFTPTIKSVTILQMIIIDRAPHMIAI